MLMKGVILCAGRGTRMQPFSNTMPKSLLPVANRPLLDHCIRKMKDVGIEEIAVVINPAQKSLEEYVNGYEGAKLRLVYQKEPRGIAHALQEAKSFLRRSPFLLLLGDNLIAEPMLTLLQSFRGRDAAVLLARVDRPQDYGIAELEGERIVSLVEKPQEPKSDLAVIGAYAFRSSIFEAIRRIAPSARGEYEITDAIQNLIDSGRTVSFSVTDRPYFDVGTVPRWKAANRWMLEEELGASVRVGENTQLENCVLRGPVLIGDHCRLKNAVIGPYVAVQDRCELSDCCLEDALILQEAQVLNLKVKGSILGARSRLEGRTTEGDAIQCLLGDRSQVRWMNTGAEEENM
jgi:glucose-1-phosphate thymidylyltransferase